MKKKSKYVIGWFPVILLLLVCPLSGQAQDYLQKRINVDYQNATMRDVLKDLTQKTGVEFLYNQDETSKTPDIQDGTSVFKGGLGSLF